MTVGGLGVGKLAGLAAREGSEAATVLARTSGAMNAGANWVDTAATANSAIDLVTNWNEMTPGQRAETGLQLAFWAGMRGVSARNTGQGLDGYSFRQQMNHAMLETGAAVKPNPALGAHDVSIVPKGGLLGGFEVQYGSQASKAVIDVHTAAAGDMLLKNAGPDGALRRAITGKGWQPGSRGEQVMVEVAKHQTLMEHYDQALQSKVLSAEDRQTLTAQRASVGHDLKDWQSKLSEIEANPALGRAPAKDGGVIDVKMKNTHWTNPEETIPRSAQANASWDRLQTTDKSAYPGAKPVEIGRDGLTLPNGTKVTNTGTRGINLRKFVTPQSEGGDGGRIFYDEKSGTMILAVNMRSKANPNLVDRVEVPFRPTEDGWRPDFSKYSPYSTKIDPKLKANRELHFGEANKKLAADWAKDPSIKGRLGLNPEEAALVERGVRESPEPYTWHHVNNQGDIELVDSAIHEVFLHDGGMKDWGNK